ncbi:unnamed protein product [Schistosoma mattheei]|uniref:Uncharacterized protein n=1 Tax=Schistosoma mattheei TaxID=31246 RepID=A0AA85B081_9TREM|nr:unnamed protein product [Schistosoma mattheei]
MKNSKLEQLLFVSGEIAPNIGVSIVPKTPYKPSTEKSVKFVNKNETVPSSLSTPLSSNNPTSIISSKPSNIAFNLTRNQIAIGSTVSSLVNSASLSNVKEDDPNTTTQPNITSAFTVSLTANDSGNLFVKSTLFKPQTPSSLLIVSTSSGGASIAQSSAPFDLNSSKVTNPVFQNTEPTITTTNNSIITSVTTINETSLINSNPVIPTTSSFSNPLVIPKPIASNPSNDFNNASPFNLPQTTTVSSKSPGLSSLLPTPVCGSSGIMFGSGQSQIISTATTDTAISSSLSSIFTGIPLNTTSTIITNSNTTTESNVIFNSRPSFGAPNLVTATTIVSSTSSTGTNIFLLDNPNQLSSTINMEYVTTVSHANTVICLTGISISKSEAFNKTPTKSVSSVFGGLFAEVATVNSQHITCNSANWGTGLLGSPMGSDTQPRNNSFSVSN